MRWEKKALEYWLPFPHLGDQQEFLYVLFVETLNENQLCLGYFLRPLEGYFHHQLRPESDKKQRNMIFYYRFVYQVLGLLDNLERFFL